MSKKINLQFHFSKRDIRGYVDWVKDLPLILAKNAFMVVLFLIVVDIFIVGAIFYYDIILPERVGLESAVAPVAFKQNIYESVLDVREKRDAFLKNSSSGDILNPFK